MLTNTIKEGILSQDVTLDEFYTRPNEMLPGNLPFIDFELDELKTEFIREDSDTTLRPETYKNNEQEHRLKYINIFFNPIVVTTLMVLMIPHSSIKTVMKAQVFTASLITQI